MTATTRRWPKAVLSLTALAAVLAAGCANSTAPPSAVTGGVVTFAEQPSTPPNYIFPMTSGSYDTVATTTNFSYLIYPPLYWFGSHGEPVLNRALSMAQLPIFSDHNTQVTIDLKHWMWSNGRPITARDLTFWMNLLSAVTDPNAPAIGSNSAPGPGWGSAVPGGFPENVVSYAQQGTYSVVLKLNASYNPTWFLYNELSQITLMPQASWDLLSAGGSVGNYDLAAAARTALPGTSPAQYVPRSPGTASTGALGVAQFLNSQSEDLGIYTSNPLWQMVDGPFRLAQFTSDGFAKLVPNKSYSGTPKPRIRAFEEMPFTTDSAEFNSLRSGALTIGYLPVQDLSQRGALERQEGYDYAPWYDFRIHFFPYNFTSPTAGPLLRELYFRQAFQSLINQPQYIKQFAGGIGTINNGPVPGYPPKNPDESPLEYRGQVYPFSPGRAVSLLRSHGWTVVPQGTSYCSRPGSGSSQCGPGIPAHAPLVLSLVYASGDTELTNEMVTMQSAMRSAAGITLNLSTEAHSQVLSEAFNSCTTTTPCSGWQLANWGGGWVYSPDYLPTGGELFATAASSNAGDYSSATNDANIQLTHTSPTPAAEVTALFRYEDYLARQLPVVWMPNGPYQLTMYTANLGGLLPQGVFDEIYPQDYTLSG